MDNIMTVAHNPGSTKAGAMVSEGDDNGIHPGVASAFKEVMGAMLYKDSSDKVVGAYSGYLERERSGEKLGITARRNLKYYQGLMESKRSDFYQSSFKVGGEKKNSYWVRTHEMFARAFESYVEDRLTETGRESSYLVAGTRGGPSAPYPHGEERKKINAAIGKLVDAIRQTKTLEKSLQKLYILR
jgi:hypothetical protein